MRIKLKIGCVIVTLLMGRTCIASDGLIRGEHYECRETSTPFSPDPILMKQNTYSTLHFNMNWGWGGSYNGYYAYNNFNPNGYTFNYQPGMVVNIRP